MSYVLPENSLPSKVLYIDSRDAEKYLATDINGNDIHSYFSYILKESISIPPNQRALISLHSATIPFSFYNIRQGVNDKISIRLQETSGGTADFTHLLTIAEGNYTAYSLSTYLSLEIPLLFASDAISTISLSISFNTDKQKYTYTLTNTNNPSYNLLMTWDFSSGVSDQVANIETKRYSR